jgi:hypothetical protein
MRKSFFMTMAILLAAPAQQAVSQIRDRQAFEQFSRQIASMSSWYGESDQKPGVSAAQLSQAVISGLKQGTYDSVIFGETHGDAQEQGAAKLIIGDILQQKTVGAFLEEACDVEGNAMASALESDGDGARKFYKVNIFGSGDPSAAAEGGWSILKTSSWVGIFQPTEQLIGAKVPILLMKNQFNPESDIQAALKAAVSGVLITYSGSVHTSVRARDFVIETLKTSDMHWNDHVPGRPVIEQSLQRHQKKPVIIAMMEEAWILGRICDATLTSASDNVPLARLQANLEALQAAWQQAIAAFPAGNDIRFVQVPEQENFYIGITPAERRPLAVAAVLKVARMPEVAQWLGQQNIKSAYAGAFSMTCPGDASACSGFQVSLDKGTSDTFTKDIWLKDLP